MSKSSNSKVSYVIFTADNRILTGYYAPPDGYVHNPTGSPNLVLIGALGNATLDPLAQWYARLAPLGTPQASRPLRYVSRDRAEVIAKKIPGSYVDTVRARPL